MLAKGNLCPDDKLHARSMSGTFFYCFLIRFDQVCIFRDIAFKDVFSALFNIKDGSFWEIIYVL